MDSVELQCYNKGCGMKYYPKNNTENSCQFHPGVPVFHDALKGWSCCKKRTTDFTDFLKIPGCTISFHSNVKPVQEKPKAKPTKEVSDVIPLITNPVIPPNRIIKDDFIRPSADELLKPLLVKLASSYNKEKLSQIRNSNQGDEVKIGTKCRNGGCESCYSNTPSDRSSCLYHPGTPVFHEGMKYWSCCKRKTSDFTSFLNQAGCTKGNHVWKKSLETVAPCRYDFHETGQNVTISIFSKRCNADTSSFEANQVYLKVKINFEGIKQFDLNLNLFGVINPEKSSVVISANKVEVNLRKARAGTWKKLGEVDDKKDDNEKIKKEIDEIKKEIEREEDERSDGSELDGIDDVIFD